jgi:hypothetical protein
MTSEGWLNPHPSVGQIYRRIEARRLERQSMAGDSSSNSRGAKRRGGTLQKVGFGILAVSLGQLALFMFLGGMHVIEVGSGVGLVLFFVLGSVAGLIFLALGAAVSYASRD